MDRIGVEFKSRYSEMSNQEVRKFMQGFKGSTELCELGMGRLLGIGKVLNVGEQGI
jgi:hypothetical protein